jgi:hypothetical protein
MQRWRRSREGPPQGAVLGRHDGGLVFHCSRPVADLATQNVFSKLAKSGTDIYRVLVVDLLHDWWLGVWKSTFIHLIRILHVVGLDSVAELDTRQAVVFRPALYLLTGLILGTEV